MVRILDFKLVSDSGSLVEVSDFNRLLWEGQLKLIPDYLRYRRITKLDVEMRDETIVYLIKVK